MARESYQFPKGSKVVVALSGGVDSSVTAALMKEAGYDVVAITMKTYASTAESACFKHGCCTLADIEDARSVSDRLGIPHYVVNMKANFEEKIVRPFVSDYLSGKTPNPCVRCNTYIKFDALLEQAQALGAVGVVTGHYAQIYHDPQKGLWTLGQGLDIQKDQSYVLFDLTQHQLKHTMLPLGGFEKPKVRALAESFGLSVSQKKDSYEICFIPDNDYGAFVKKYAGRAHLKGPIRLKDGPVVGEHEGAFRYTIGQRKRLNVPGYPGKCVVGIEDNTVIIGEESDIHLNHMVLERVHWHDEPVWEEEVIVQIRAHHSGVAGFVKPLKDDRVHVHFVEPVRAVTPGQAAVWYDANGFVLGGGWIQRGCHELPSG